MSSFTITGGGTIAVMAIVIQSWQLFKMFQEVDLFCITLGHYSNAWEGHWLKCESGVFMYMYSALIGSPLMFSYLSRVCLSLILYIFLAAMSPMYMVPHRPMFAAGQTALPAAHPGYLPMATAAATAPHQQIVMPELTVKTSTSQPTAHASTSPNKPMSAASSPKVVSVLCMLIITSLFLRSVTRSCFIFFVCDEKMGRHSTRNSLFCSSKGILVSL